MESWNENAAGSSEAQRVARRWYAALIVVAVVVVAFVVWRRRHRRHVAHKNKAHVVAVTTASVALPNTPAPQTLALELWVKDPEAITAKIIPLVVPPDAPKAMLPTFAQIVKNGLPPELQPDIDQIDFHQPLGYLSLGADANAPPPPPGEGGRFVLAATVKDHDGALKAVADYAAHEGAAKEHSNALNADMYKGVKTGRYLGVVGTQVMLGSDLLAIEQAAPRLGEGLPLAKVQAHDLVARAPEAWVSGPFAKSVEAWWNGFIGQQLGGATAGPAKALSDSIAAAAKDTWPGAQDVEVVADVGTTNATATATLRVSNGTPLSTFLSTFPTGSPTTLGDAPRDALGAISLHLPPSWMDLVRKLVKTPPPEADKLLPPEIKEQMIAAYGGVMDQIEGDVLLANVIDATPNPGPGATVIRFKIKDNAQAKKAAHDFFAFVTLLGTPPGVTAPPAAALTTDGGGSGEALEQNVPPQNGQPPLPPIGFAWAVRDEYAYVCVGANPRAHLLQLASPSGDGHIRADEWASSRIGRLPAAGAAYVFEAPFRKDAPIAAAMGIPPLSEAITVSVVPSPNALSIVGDFDLALAVQVLGPMFLQPAGGPGQPGMPAPGGSVAVPPGAMMPPGIPGPKPGGGTKPPPNPGAGTGKPIIPPVVVPPAPTGYVLPLPTHKSND